MSRFSVLRREILEPDGVVAQLLVRNEHGNGGGEPHRYDIVAELHVEPAVLQFEVAGQSAPYYPVADEPPEFLLRQFDRGQIFNRSPRFLFAVSGGSEFRQ
jgi:hypothetical protein